MKHDVCSKFRPLFPARELLLDFQNNRTTCFYANNETTEVRSLSKKLASVVIREKLDESVFGPSLSSRIVKLDNWMSVPFKEVRDGSQEDCGDRLSIDNNKQVICA